MSTTASSLPVDSSTIHMLSFHYFNNLTPYVMKTQHVPPKRDTDHTIHLTPNTGPIIVRPFHYPHFKKQETKPLVLEMVSDILIRHSTSAFHPRVCWLTALGISNVDYWVFNQQIIKNNFPIPVVDELLDELYESKLFAKLDLLSGYHQIMQKQHFHKMTFRTHNGHYEFVVIPFGLTNAHTTFQATMNH